MEKGYEGARQGGQTGTAAWSRKLVLDGAAEYLASGGEGARRELVRTMLGLGRLLGRAA